MSKTTNSFQKTNTKLGHKRQCRECWSSYMKEYYKRKPSQYNKHKKYVQENDIEYKRSYARHHISKEDFEKILKKYDGMCYACKEKNATCIDHDHSCCDNRFSCGNCIRGVLCNWCNSALGHAQDRVDILEKLIGYLRPIA